MTVTATSSPTAGSMTPLFHQRGYSPYTVYRCLRALDRCPKRSSILDLKGIYIHIKVILLGINEL